MRAAAPSLFESIGRRIEAFSNRSEKASLLSRTGSGSALPRGALFGLNDAREVAAALAHRRVKVLFIGANPGMKEPSRLKTKGLSDYLATGRYGEVYWDAAQRIQPGWNPFFDAGTWKRSYGQWLARLGVLEETAMLNFIPWRSSDLPRRTRSLAAMRSRASVAGSSVLRRASP